MIINDPKIGEADLSGNMTQQSTQKKKVSVETPHVSNMGKMLEEIELRIRNNIEGIYIQKTREVINGHHHPILATLFLFFFFLLYMEHVD